MTDVHSCWRDRELHCGEQSCRTLEQQHTKRALRTDGCFRCFWIAVSLLVIFHVVAFDLAILATEDSLQVQYTPDDAYYYLCLARNYSNLGFWTFDSGQSVTSGFHPLWAYLLSGAYTIARPSQSTFVRMGIIASSLTTLLSLLVAWRFSLRFAKPHYLMLLALLPSSRNFLYNSVSVTEWPLAVLASTLYCIMYIRSVASSAPQRYAIPMFLLGFAGTLARSEFGLLPLSVLVASFLLFLLGSHHRPRTAAIGLVGAAAGVLASFAHNIFYTDDLLQSSARIKSYWAHAYGPNVIGVVRIFRDILGLEFLHWALFIAVVGLLSLLFLVVGVAKLNRASGCRNHASPCRYSLPIAAVLCVAGYGLFYLNNPSIQPWYSANLVVPVYVLPRYFRSAVILPRIRQAQPVNQFEDA